MDVERIIGNPHRYLQVNQSHTVARGPSCKMTLDTHRCLCPPALVTSWASFEFGTFIHANEAPASHLVWSRWGAPEEGGEFCSRLPTGWGGGVGGVPHAGTEMKHVKLSPGWLC